MRSHSTRYPAEVRERAVRLVFEHQGEHGSLRHALASVPVRTPPPMPAGPIDGGIDGSSVRT